MSRLAAPLLGILWACARPEPAAPPVAATRPGPRPEPRPELSAICAESDAFIPQHAETLAAWAAQDAAAPGPADPVVFVGSSTIRLWGTLAQDFADLRPIQRGFGGAELAEVARYTQDLVLRHHPRAVVVFAGTNDIHAGVAPETVLGRLRCLLGRVEAGAPGVPVFYIGITPTPARWAEWDRAQQVNAGAVALQAEFPALVYLDTPAIFLATGAPPDRALFIEDGLHLNAQGYAMLGAAVREALESRLAGR